MKGAYIINLEKFEDERGFFARSWDKKIFEDKKLNSNLVQCNISFSKKKGTLRGMHYQSEPYEEAKVVWCPKGSIFDVIIDLREKSETFLQWEGFELNENNHMMIYVPEGFAHGFMTLENDTTIFYQMSEMHMPDYAKGVLWNDPSFNIKWPMKPNVISKRDESFSPFQK